MKKYLFAAACALIVSTASADPSKYNLTFTCPNVDVISNFGDYLGAYGTELIFGESHPVYFRSTVWPSNVPGDVNTYASYAANYNALTAQVICSYMSTNTEHASFDLLYYISNGKGGLITAQTESIISLEMPVGLTQ